MKSRYIMKLYVMLCYFMLCYVMLCFVMLYYVLLCYVMLCYVMSCHVMSCHVMSCHVMSCHVMSCHIILYPIILSRSMKKLSSIVHQFRLRRGKRSKSPAHSRSRALFSILNARNQDEEARRGDREATGAERTEVLGQGSKISLK